MSSLKKEYTRTIQNIWQAFYDHDEKRIDLIKKEIILRLNKYCEFYNHYGRDANSDNFDDHDEIFERLANYYNIPETVWNPEHYSSKIPKKRIRIYEHYIKHHYCKGIPDERDELGFPYSLRAIYYMDEMDDLDLAYIFFGVSLGEWYPPKPFCYWMKSYNSILHHIENRTNWKNGFYEQTWKNGNKQWAGNYVNGLQHGDHIVWSPGGTRSTSVQWSNGCQTGIEYYYDEETSKIYMIEIRKNGELMMSTEHHLDISRIKGERWNAVAIVKYDEINMLNHPLIVTKKRKHGKFKKGSGNWYFKGEYENNVPIGIWREYLNGKLIYELAYKNGEIDLENSIFRYKRTGTPIPWNKLK